jgi:hypothetical protein
VALLWPEQSSADGSLCFVKDFAIWLRRYDEEFKKCVVTEPRLDLLYHRSLLIVAAGASMTAHLVRELCPLAHELGLAPAIHARIRDFAGEMAAFRELLRLCSPGTVVLDAHDVDCLGGASVGHDLASAVLDEGVALSLVGPPQYWRSTGLFGATAFNAKQPTITFADRTLRSRHAARRFHQGIGGKNPCMGRLRLFVTPDGLIYPCQALVGSKSLAIGDIRSDGLVNHVAGEDLGELYKNGPRLTGVEPVDDELPAIAPAICILHKRQLEAKLAHTNSETLRVSVDCVS